jgi:hypothetical protein
MEQYQLYAEDVDDPQCLAPAEARAEADERAAALFVIELDAHTLVELGQGKVLLCGLGMGYEYAVAVVLPRYASALRSGDEP